MERISPVASSITVMVVLSAMASSA